MEKYYFVALSTITFSFNLNFLSTNLQFNFACIFSPLRQLKIILARVATSLFIHLFDALRSLKNQFRECFGDEFNHFLLFVP